MRVVTYLKYTALGAMAMGLTMVGVTAQEVPATPPSTPQVNGDCNIRVFDSAQFQKEMAQMQRRIQESLKEVQARASLYGAEVAREMTENGMKSEELANLATEARNSAQQAKQLFGQSVLLDADEGTGWLGLEMTEITAEKAKELNLNPVRGVQVTEILPDGPAAKAGLQTNDVIVQYDGHDVEGTVQFRRLVRETPPGRSVPITVLRAGREQKMTIQVGNRTKSLQSEWREAEEPLVLSVPSQAYNFKMEMPEIFMGMTPTLGIEAEDVTGQLGAYFKVPGDDGVLVRSVSKDTPAAKAGLKAGDVITRVDGLTVTTLAELRAQLREKREEKSVSLMVMRQGTPVSVTVTIETPQPEPTRTRSAAL